MFKTRKVDFLFLVEHEDRELYSVKRISEELTTYGASSLILSMEFYSTMISSLSVKVIVVPYAISKILGLLIIFFQYFQRFRLFHLIGSNF